MPHLLVHTNADLSLQDVVPKTAANFRAIAQGNTEDKKLTYKGSIFHRIIPGVSISPLKLSFFLLISVISCTSSCFKVVTLNDATGQEVTRFMVANSRVSVPYFSTVYDSERVLDENFDKKHTRPGLLSMASTCSHLANVFGCSSFPQTLERIPTAANSSSQQVEWCHSIIIHADISTVPTPWLDGNHVVFGSYSIDHGLNT